MYVAVKGGEAAIRNAHRLLADRRRGDRSVPALRLDQIVEQLGARRRPGDERRLALRPGTRGAGHRAGARRPDRGDLPGARLSNHPAPLWLHAAGRYGAMHAERRISATYKDLPGGQMLGPTFDYTHRLLDPDACGGRWRCRSRNSETRRTEAMPRVSDILGGEGLIEADGDLPAGHVTGDITREPLEFPLERDARLQALSRGDEGFLLALAYSTQRGYARSHPFVGEIRIGEVELELDVPELGFPVTLGRIRVTECQMVNQFKGSAKAPPQFTRGYGLVFGQSERKAMAMSLCDRALRARELGEDITAAGAGRGIRHLAFRQRAGDRLRRAPEAAALCRLPGRTRPGAPHAGRTRRQGTAHGETHREAAE